MILCSGCFDGLHAGHVLYLEAAKALCEGDELLVCAIAPDEYICQTKGRAPYWHQHDRVRTVTALGCVDAAIPQQHQSVAQLIYDHRPRLFVKGPDWEGRLPEDIQRACESVGTAIGYVDTPGRHVRETRVTDEEALARFEHLVQSQVPAAKDWAPVTDYSFEARQAIEGQHPQLIKEVFTAEFADRSLDSETPDHLSFMDVGCGPGHLVKMLRELGLPAYGCDRQRYASWFTRPPRDPNLRYLDWRRIFDVIDITDECALCCEHGEWLEADVLICREVLEHLTIQQIKQAVVNLCKASARFVYVTTRFKSQPQHLLDVDTADALDPTHISMLNQTFLRALFVLEGFRRRADLETKMDWQKKGRVLVYERA